MWLEVNTKDFWFKWGTFWSRSDWCTKVCPHHHHHHRRHLFLLLLHTKLEADPCNTVPFLTSGPATERTDVKSSCFTLWFLPLLPFIPWTRLLSPLLLNTTGRVTTWWPCRQRWDENIKGGREGGGVSGWHHARGVCGWQGDTTTRGSNGLGF